MAAHHPHTHIHLEPFKGQGEDPERWLAYFERYCQYHNLNADRAALSMPFHLKGVAKIWFDSLQDATQSSFRLLREAFIARFKPQNNIDITVLSMCQKQEETVEEYYSRFIDNVATKDLPENIQITVITKGLLPQLVALVMLQNPQTLEELRQAMVLAEQTHRALQPKQSVASTASTYSNLTEEIRCLRNQLSEVLAIQSNNQQQQASRYQNNYQHQQPSYQQPNRVPDYQGRRSYPQMPPRGQRPEERPQQQPQDYWKCGFCGGKRFHTRLNCPASNQICRHCNKKGHFMRECRAARRSNNRF